MASEVDLVITFRATKATSLSKQQIRKDTQKAEVQYQRLLDTLRHGGLRAVGRRGESLGHLMVFLSCPGSYVTRRARREKHSDFLSGLPTTPLGETNLATLSPADRTRLVHTYVTSTPSDGGLGIMPGSANWDLVESVMALHDRDFNERWIRDWTLREIASVQLNKIRDQFGDAIALYFDFLSSYTKALVFPAFLGIFYHFFGTPYSPTYSILVFFWSIIFVEWWRVRERILSLRFGTRGSFRVEKRRADHKPGFPWWKRELRILATLPVLLLFAGVLAVLLTGIFVFEAFVTQLYTGPGQKFISFSPTILFAALIPRFLAIYQVFARALTTWENHTHYSTHAASLTIKTFALNALVAYLGLGLSAFVYVPFGEGVMQIVQTRLFHETINGRLKDFNMTQASNTSESNITASAPSKGFWDMDTSNAKMKLNPGRLREQMFAYTVTSQVVGTFVEVGLPFVLRALASFRSGKKPRQAPAPGSPGVDKNGSGNAKKKVVFEDEKEKGGLAERNFLDGVRAEVALPEYELFDDYSEMVIQFGYVALWSTIWPLAPVMALLNNFLELRSDAFKMTVHNRRPIPNRTDTIGPWLEALTFLTWLSALTNSALVYLFCPRSRSHCSSQLDKVQQHIFSQASPSTNESGVAPTKELLMTVFLIALAASHGYILLRVLVRHVMERLFWTGSEDVKKQEQEDKDIKERFLNEVLMPMQERKVPDATGYTEGFTEAKVPVEGSSTNKSDELGGFWDNDEGLDEISRVSKEL